MEENRLMQPAISLMGGLNYKTKFVMIFVLFLLPLGMLSFMFLKDLREQTANTRLEIIGIEYIQALNSLLREVTDHRGSLNALLNGDASFRERVLAKQAAVDKALAAVSGQDRERGELLQIGGRGSDLLAHWNTLKKEGFDMPPRQAFEAHNRLVNEINELVRHVAVTSSLILDPDLESNFLASIVSNRLPPLIESVARLRGLSTGVAAQKTILPDERIQILSRRDAVLTNADSLEFELRVAFQAQDRLRAQLDKVSAATLGTAREYVRHIDAQLLDAESISARAEMFFDEGTEVLDKVWALNGAISPSLHALFEARLVRNWVQEWSAYVVTTLVVLINVYLFAGFYLAVRQTIARVDEGAQALAGGDLSARIKVGVSDEMARIAASFNAMAATLEEKTRREREQMEELRKAADIRDRVAVLRAHIEQVAAGDLTRRMEVSGNDDLAQLGSKLNDMTESLARVASGTQDAVNAMYAALEEMQSAINSQSSGASQQAEAVNQTSTSMEEVKNISTQTLDKARMLGEAADRTRRESEQGLASISHEIAGMEGIRQRMEGIATTILSLSEQTQQIGEITAVVTNLAQQSKMLALNASIEAAKAGEAGKGFAVVAAEVRELAEQSQQSTAQVQKILQDIRHATDRAVMATEEGSKGVDAGVISVQRNGEVMRQLDEVIRETTLASQQIVAAVRQEVVGIDQIARSMSEITKVTAHFVTSVQQSKASTNELRKVAERLRESVSVFRL